MAVYVEFIVLGPPVSNQSAGPNPDTWRATVRGAATPLWPNPPLTVNLKVILINFFAGNKPSVDVDNMSKPILDALQTVVYDDDRQIVQAEMAHVRIGAAFSILGVRPIIVNAIQAGQQFVYVRVEDVIGPYPLPK